MTGAPFPSRPNLRLVPPAPAPRRILDGRNRYRACIDAGIEPRFEQFSDRDPLAFVVSLNLARRHLSESQRAIVAAKIATLKDGQRSDLVQGLPIGRAAEMLNVGKRSVARAKAVLDEGIPELAIAIERGEISVSAAAELTSLPEPEQREIVAAGTEAVWLGCQECENVGRRLAPPFIFRTAVQRVRRQCGDLTLRILVTPGSDFLPCSAKTGDGMPHRAIINSRPSGWFRTIGAE